MNRSGWLMYAVSGIWAIALIATSLLLKETPQSNTVIEVLSACAVLTGLLMILSCKRRAAAHES